MLRSLVRDPLSWWPVGFAIGWLICEVLAGIQRARDRRDAGTSRPADDHADPVQALRRDH